MIFKNHSVTIINVNITLFLFYSEGYIMKKLLYVLLVFFQSSYVNAQNDSCSYQFEDDNPRLFDDIFFTICSIIKYLVDIENITEQQIDLDDYFYIGSDGGVYLQKNLGEFPPHYCLFPDYQFYTIMQAFFVAIPLYQYLAFLEEIGDISSVSSIEDIGYALSQKPYDFVLDIDLSDDNMFAQCYWMTEMFASWIEFNIG